MSKHTPGPWEYSADWSEYDSIHTEFSLDAGDTNIISGCGCCGSPTISSEADARLIAAAPELLEALEAFIFIDYRSWDADAQTKWEACYAAITKAKGEVML